MSTGASSPRGSAARIVPRVFVSVAGAIRIDLAVAEAVGAGARVVEVVGGAGAGKTTAIRFLEEQLSELGLLYFDANTRNEELQESIARGQVIVVASDSRRRLGEGVVLQLAPWGRDEVIEWAIGEPREARGSFVERAMAIMDECDEDCPEVLAAIFRVLCENADTNGFAAAIGVALREQAGDDPAVFHAAAVLAWTACRPRERASEPRVRPDAQALRLLRHQSASLHMAAEYLSSELGRGSPTLLAQPIAGRVIELAAAGIGRSATALHTLRVALDGPGYGFSESMAVSVLHAAGADWKASSGEIEHIRNFQRARLPGVRWPAASLVSAELARANFRGANLRRANLTRAKVLGARFTGANLCEATMVQIRGYRADFSRAALAGADLKEAVLSRTSFAGADMTGICGEGAMLAMCDLRDACLRGANLGASVLGRCEIGEADLTGASFRLATLRGLNLRSATLDDLVLEDAQLHECDLAGVLATGMNCRNAKLIDCEMTGSVLRCACFAGARLKGCGLAEIWWQGADLRGADLRGSTFHMGSSRSGLVGSTIAGEGSRTGFYTDDFAAQDYKPPEEISKADLRGADLRGAKVEGVDFYLVDLRGAIYEQEQAEWFRKCGAILFARVGD